jgi:hypothetical protein
LQFLGIARLEKIFGLIGCLQPEDMLLFGVVIGPCRQRVVYSDGIVNVVRELWNDNIENKFQSRKLFHVKSHLIFVESSLILVQIHHERISQRAVEHLPRALSEWS